MNFVKFTRWQSCLIILSIVFQSVVGIVNAQDIHQVDRQHVQSEHFHAQDDIAANTTGSLSSDSDHNSADCHHCGHCHGSHAQWVVSPFVNDVFHKKNDARFRHTLSINDGYSSDMMRPPIS